MWLTVTTPNGYWPLLCSATTHGKGNHGLKASLGSKLLYSWPYAEQKNQPDEAAQVPLIEGVSRLWYSLAFVLIGICILPLLAIQGRLDCSSLPLLCSFAYGPPADRNAFGRAFFRAVVFLSLAMLCLLLAWPTVVLWRNGPGWEALTVSGMLSVMGIGLLFAVAWDVARVRRAPRQRGQILTTGSCSLPPSYWSRSGSKAGARLFTADCTTRASSPPIDLWTSSTV